MFRPLLETTEEKGLPWSLRHANPHDIAPRIGLAWRPFGSTKTVVRSAYGIFYVYPDSNILLGQVRTPPFVILQVTSKALCTVRDPGLSVLMTPVPETLRVDLALLEPVATADAKPSTLAADATP